jgi:hypothetical protein
MKKILTLLVVFITLNAFSQTTEVQQKIDNLIADYLLSNPDLTATEIQEMNDLLVDYYNGSGSEKSTSILNQSQTNNVIGKLITNTSGLTSVTQNATSVIASYDESLSATDPIFNRIYETLFDASNLCQTQGTLSTSGTNVYYDVIQFSVTDPGEIDIEMVSGTFDGYLLLYCNFDPLNPQQNVIFTDDDSGTGLLARLVDMDLPMGNYYLVVSSFDSGVTGSYSIEFRSDNGQVVLGEAVPVGYAWIVGLFCLIAIGAVIKRFFY